MYSAVLNLRNRVLRPAAAVRAVRPFMAPRLKSPAYSTTHRLLRPGPLPFRHFSTAPLVLGPVHEKRNSILANKIAADEEVDLRQIMADLRDLELLDMLNRVSPKSGSGYKDATRALYPLFHQCEQQNGKCSFGELHAALPPLYGLAWNAIAERLLDGRVSKLDCLDKEDKAALLFLQIYIIGPARARDFAADGCRTFEDLLDRDEQLKPKLSRANKIGLVYREDVQRLIPRIEMDALRDALGKVVQTIDPAFEFEILGSYRRGVPFSSDIDLAVRHRSFVGSEGQEALGKSLLGSIIEKLEVEKLVRKEHELARGVKKFAGLIRLPGYSHYRRIDIRLAPFDSYPYMLLGSSGDSLLMKLLRYTVKQKGYCLNEYGMGDKFDAVDENPNGFKPGTLKVVESEEQIFKLLGLPYLAPTERDFRTWGPKYLREVKDAKARDFVTKL